MKVKIITIGDEILIGQIIDTNSAFISKELINIGVEVTEILTIGDSKIDITNSLKNSQIPVPKMYCYCKDVEVY